jgi:hypothetical protein
LAEHISKRTGSPIVTKLSTTYARQEREDIRVEDPLLFLGDFDRNAVKRVKSDLSTLDVETSYLSEELSLIWMLLEKLEVLELIISNQRSTNLEINTCYGQ